MAETSSCYDSDSVEESLCTADYKNTDSMSPVFETKTLIHGEKPCRSDLLHVSYPLCTVAFKRNLIVHQLLWIKPGRRGSPPRLFRALVRHDAGGRVRVVFTSRKGTVTRIALYRRLLARLKPLRIPQIYARPLYGKA